MGVFPLGNPSSRVELGGEQQIGWARKNKALYTQRMNEYYCEWVPDNQLSPFVAKIWAWHGPLPPTQALRFLPSGSAQLFFSFTEIPFEARKPEQLGWEVLAPSVFIGPQFSYFDMKVAPMEKMAGVIFKPGGTLPFFSPKTSDLVDQLISAQDLSWEGEVIPPGLRDLTDPFLAPALLGSWLVEKLTIPTPQTRVYGELPQWDGKIARVDDLTERFGMSAKRLTRIFHVLFGVHPKRFARVRRFNRALKKIFEQQNHVLVNVAGDVGCFDQSHLNREFKLFSGISPAEYLRHAKSLYYFPLPDRHDLRDSWGGSHEIPRVGT